MWSTIMTLMPMVLEYTMIVSEYLETKYSDLIMVSANGLGSEDVLSTLVTLIPKVLEYTMVVSQYLEIKYSDSAVGTKFDACCNAEASRTYLAFPFNALTPFRRVCKPVCCNGRLEVLSRSF